MTALTCLLIGWGLSALVVRAERERVLAEHGARLDVAASVLAQRLDERLEGWVLDLARLGRALALAERPPTPQELRRMLEDLRQRAPDYGWLGLVDAGGRVLVATDGASEGQDVSAQPWFASGLEGPFMNRSHPVVLTATPRSGSPAGGAAPLLLAATPVIGPSGHPLGVVAAELRLSWVEAARREVLQFLSEAAAPDLLVLDREGQVLLGAAAAPAIGQVPSLAHDWIVDDGRISVIEFTQGSAVHPGLGWMVLAQRDTAAALAPLRKLALWLFFGTLAVAATCGLLAGAVVGRFRRELRALHEGESGQDATEDLERVAARLRQLRETAYRDPLTGLLNRAGFTAWRAAHPEAERNCVLLALDLDGFKPINDRLGHAAGDAMLQAIGRWLEGHLRQGDCAARLGGDEFLICLQAPVPMMEIAAVEVVSRFQAALAGGLHTPHGRLALGCSIGIAIIPRDAEDIDAGLLHADAELYRIKRLRKPEASDTR
ncbi:diguanylate cyclase domain-containing protein [Falsiroseomonas sp.]|uniref:GGDEF domain-containing protein n=1 Tax=Falsiroseomonas sp. TaxID=2870721 RepID=UPI003F71F221